MLSRLSRFLILLISVFILIPLVAAASFTVRSGNLQGWIIMPDGTLPYNFITGAASTGLGSLQFGPIDGGNPINKFVIQAPYLNGLASDFSSFSYDIYVDPTSLKGSQYFYVNIYVDSAVNGPGTAPSWYDCRYDFATPSGLASGVWHNRSFDLNFTGWVSKGEPMGVGTCPNSIAALPANSRIMFFRINGGGSTAADAGFSGGIDNVAITTSAATDTYDFEPNAIVSPTTGEIVLLQLPLDERINNFDAAAPIAAYGLDFGAERGLIIYEINDNSRGFGVLVVSPEEIAAVPELPEENTLIAETETDNLVIFFWRLSSSEFQLNVTQPNGKMYVLIFSEFVSGGAGYTSFEYEMK